MNPNNRSGLFALGSLGVLFLGASGSTLWLAMNHRQLAAANRRLTEERQALNRDLEQHERALAELSDRRRADEAEILRMQKESIGHTATVMRLRDHVTELETRTITLQEEIAKARTDGQVKEATLADLSTRLAETRSQAESTAQALRVMGYTKDELTDQVGKLRTRLAESDQSLADVRKHAQEQQQAMARLNDDLFARSTALTALRNETEILRVNNGQLQRELASRPKPSPFGGVETYSPSRDRPRGPGG